MLYNIYAFLSNIERKVWNIYKNVASGFLRVMGLWVVLMFFFSYIF